MKYLDNVWFNWFDRSSVGCNIPEFFEWRAEDSTLERAAKVPLVKVTSNELTYIEQGCSDIPKELLSIIKEAVSPIVITDGERALGLNKVYSPGDEVKVLVSRLIPKEEDLAVKAAKDQTPLKINIRPSKETSYTQIDNVLDKITKHKYKQEYLVGLTRKEKELRDILLDCLFSLACSGDRKELEYWYVEVFPKMYGQEDMKKATNEEIIESMYDVLKCGWGEVHQEFGSNIIKYYDTLKEDWDRIISSSGQGKEKNIKS